MALDKYRSKRNFKGTPEPEGKEEGKTRRKKTSTRKTKTAELRFVIQLHDASRRHYDLRLEIDGTMKSWAVPKGPSLDPMERRLAVEVEDHPMEYNNFEGVIPRGHYGAGVVMIWDEGTYTARAVSYPAIDAEDALRRGYAKGHLTFILEGQKLKGEFALIRLAKGDGKNWLFVKKHDSHANRGDITHADRSSRSGRTLGEIGAKSPEEGKVWDTQVLSKKSQAKLKKDAHIGLGGTRKKLAVKYQKLAHRAEAIDWQKLETWRQASAGEEPLGDLSQALYDGYRVQVLIAQDGETQVRSKTNLPLSKRFPELTANLRPIGGPLLFDALIVPWDEDDKPRPRGRTQKLAKVRYALYVYDLLHADGWDLGELPCEQRLKALAMLKIQNPYLKIVVSSADDAQGIGILRRESGEAYGQSVMIEAQGARELQQARRETPAKALAGSVHHVVARTGQPILKPQLSLSSRSKVYWPDEGITKGDVLDYYQLIAPYMLPHLQDRPQSLHRQPHGVTAAGFFQKEISGQVPRWMETATIVSGRSGQSVNYALCNREADLLFLVNLGCIEINTWLSRVQTINQPDFVVFDLDPGEIAFSAVIDVANTVKRLVESLGAKAFCKTSGSRGLHVFVPVSGTKVFDETRVFAEEVCKEVNELLPHTTSLERSPSRRTKLIYLDYLQNRVGQTMAAIYSVRPRPHATVSTPLRWSEVKHGLDPSVFTIASLPKRLAKWGDLWLDIQKAAVPLSELQEALNERRRQAKTAGHSTPRQKRR